MKRRHPIVWIVAAVCSIASLWWMFYIPRRPLDLYRAIPVQAEYVGAHSQLAARWGDVCSNTVARALFGALGIRPSDLDAIGRDPQSRDWLNRLAGDEVVLAYVPNLANGEGGWVFASWLGGRSQRLRLSLQWSQAPAFEPMGRTHGWPIWRAKSNLVRTDDQLVFSLVEGMVVGCIARDPRAIDTVLNCVDGRYPSLYLQRKDNLLPLAGAPDRGWFRLSDPDAGILNAPRIRFGIEAMSPGHTTARVDLPWPLLAGCPISTNLPPESFAAGLADLPAGALWTESATALALLDRTCTNELARPFHDVLGHSVTGTVGVAMLAGNYVGHLFGLRLPTLVGGVRTCEGFDPAAWMTNELDRLNAAYRWGLVPEDASVSSTRVWAITSTASGFYASAERGEHVSVARGAEWMAMVSSSGGYTNAVQDSFLRGRRSPRLLDRVPAAGGQPAAVEAWINLPEAGRSIRFALGAYTLKTMSGDDPTRRRERAKMNLLRRWIEASEAAGTVRLWAWPEQEGTSIRVETSAQTDTITP